MDSTQLASISIIILVLVLVMVLMKTLNRPGESFTGFGQLVQAASGKNQLTPGHVVMMSESDVSSAHNPPSDLLCNWRQCSGGPGNGPKPAERLCPFCHRVGYCCEYCMQQDIYGHVSHNCAQNIKPAPIRKA